MQPRVILAALLVAASPLCGSAVYYSSCSVGPVGEPLVTKSGAGYCNLSAQLFGGGAFQLTGMAYDFSSLPVSGSVDASAQIYNDAGLLDPPQNFQILSRAYETFETAGPLRAGVIAVSLLQGNSRFGMSAAGISDGVHTYALGTCSKVLNPTENFCDNSYKAPFELGKPFSALAYIDEAGNSNSELFLPMAGASVEFSLFEADGVTPVDFAFAPDGTPGVPINITPEPRTFAMFGVMAVVGVAVGVRRRLLRVETTPLAASA
jgi:hypothetical protein